MALSTPLFMMFAIFPGPTTKTIFRRCLKSIWSKPFEKASMKPLTDLGFMVFDISLMTPVSSSMRFVKRSRFGMASLNISMNLWVGMPAWAACFTIMLMVFRTLSELTPISDTNPPIMVVTS
ncbi:MAG: hypothetical protein BWY99_02199 [Synergistetes bacterium ADurb.BinA166]|nr:MAG: hypothetical protein BWY99_02199 [Synergistetes bacterium ADurb.BinA166]